MKQGIVIGTWSGGQEACEVLVHSLWNVKYPVLIVVNNFPAMSQSWVKRLYSLTGEQDWHLRLLHHDAFEVGAIETALLETTWDEFFFLQDTFEIKNQDIFRILFEEFAGRSVSYNPHLQMYLIKYRREILERMQIPEVRTKREAIKQEEDFNRAYANLDGNIHILNPNFHDERFYGNYEEKFGRTNLKLEDEYLIKRKGTWTTEQIPKD